jgi:hypothetical protein
MKNSDLITVSRDDLKAEMQTVLSDIISDGVKNIGEMLITAFSGNRQPAAPPLPDSVSFELPVEELENPPPPLPSKDELLKTVSGYLYMALGDLKYERKDIMPILQRIEKYMRANNYEEALTAYQNAEDEFLAMLEQTMPVAVAATIAGIEVPAQFHDFRIEQLIYTSNISKGKTAKGLHSKGITHIKDFFKAENSDLNAIPSVKGKKSFIEALERTIASAPAAETAPAPEAAPSIPHREVYELNGVAVPAEMLGERVDSLQFPSKVSRTKLTNKFKEHGIVYVRDFFAEGTPPLYKMISQAGKLSFLKVLRESSENIRGTAEIKAAD